MQGTSVRGIIYNVYGPYQATSKEIYLNSMENLGRWGNKYWIIGGDFNLIKSLKEKRGGQRILNKSNLSFT